MSMPISTLCSGIDSMEILKENIGITRNFTPLTQEEITAILEKSFEYSKDGKHEWYKTYETKPDDNW
jgi:predicted aldo/keto reductase-like oxidoreductase